MKTIYAILFSGLFSLGIQNAGAQMPASISTYDIPEHTYPSLTQQIAQLIPFPGTLDEEDGVIALSFKVGKNNRISNIQVYTESEALNQLVILSLEGKHLKGEEFKGKHYRLRLHSAQSQLLAASYMSY